MTYHFNMTTLEQITAVIGKYQENYSSLSGDLLLNCQDKLSTLLYTFSDEVSTAYEQYLQAKLDRKTGVIEKQEALIEGGFKKTDAGVRAELESKELYAEENKWDSNYKRYKLLMDTAQDVLQGIRQRISVLRKEMENSKN